MLTKTKKSIHTKTAIGSNSTTQERFITLILEKIDTVDAQDWENYIKQNPLISPQNAFSKRKYNRLNKLILMLDMIIKNRVSNLYATFKQIIDHGGSVKKGAKSIPVEFFSFVIQHIETKKKITVSEYNELSIDKKQEYAIFPISKIYNVFNIDDTENLMVNSSTNDLGLDLEDADVIDDINIEQYIDNLQQDKGLKIQEKKTLSACYVTSMDIVIMPFKKDCTSINSYYCALFHEIIHWTGASTRLNRLESVKFKDKSYCFEELVAEMGSMVLCFDFDILDQFENSLRYIKGWSRSKQADKEKEFRLAFLKSIQAINFLT